VANAWCFVSRPSSRTHAIGCRYIAMTTLNETFYDPSSSYHLTDNVKINKPHLAYTILGGFTSIFMLVSLFIKEKLYIGEAS
jgi:hypothetical protein